MVSKIAQMTVRLDRGGGGLFLFHYVGAVCPLDQTFLRRLSMCSSLKRHLLAECPLRQLLWHSPWKTDVPCPFPLPWGHPFRISQRMVISLIAISSPLPPVGLDIRDIHVALFPSALSFGPVLDRVGVPMTSGPSPPIGMHVGC